METFWVIVRTFLDGKINKKSPQDGACLLPCLVGLTVQNLGYYGVLLCGAVDGLMLLEIL